MESTSNILFHTLIDWKIYKGAQVPRNHKISDLIDPRNILADENLSRQKTIAPFRKTHNFSPSLSLSLSLIHTHAITRPCSHTRTRAHTHPHRRCEVLAQMVPIQLSAHQAHTQFYGAEDEGNVESGNKEQMKRIEANIVTQVTLYSL